MADSYLEIVMGKVTDNKRHLRYIEEKGEHKLIWQDEYPDGRKEPGEVFILRPDKRELWKAAHDMIDKAME